MNICFKAARQKESYADARLQAEKFSDKVNRQAQ